ncbi:MAG: sodium:calcium antiporter, partial [Halanaeroarchaeum sp.]
ALISFKLNQWTLLIGTLAVVYSVSAGRVGTLPFDSKQTAEIWITAAQSFFAIAILVNFEISTREALALLGLFTTQVVAEFYVVQTYTGPTVTTISIAILYVFTAVYLLLGVGLFGMRWSSVHRLYRHTVSETSTALTPETTQ